MSFYSSLIKSKLAICEIIIEILYKEYCILHWLCKTLLDTSKVI